MPETTIPKTERHSAWLAHSPANLSKSSNDPDPILAAIEAHRKAEAEFGAKVLEHDVIPIPPEGEAEVAHHCDIEQRALAALANIVPTTRKGAIALLSYLAEVERDACREFDGNDGARWFFRAAVENIARALDPDDYWSGPDDPDPGEDAGNDNAELADAVAA